MRRKILNSLAHPGWIGISMLVLAHSFSAVAAPVSYIDETAFLDDLTDMGYTVVHEGFE